MHHIHMGQCPSTQHILKSHLQGSDFKEVLISCNQQIAGVGRQGKSWVQGKNSLAFSFSLKPNQVISLTSLEIGILISRFFKTNFHQDIKLKWPNDLLTDGLKKCGGILCQTFNSYLLVGVGINIGEIDFSIPDGALEISSLPITANQKDIPAKIYKYIQENRLPPEKIKMEWENLCAHLNLEIIIENENGKFLGIGDLGEILLKTENGIKKIYSGSLLISPKN